MSKIQLPADLTAKLGNATFPAELCDENGTITAVALSPDLYHEMFHIWADSVFDQAALVRARNESGGMTTPEAISHLRKVAAEYRQK